MEEVHPLKVVCEEQGRKLNWVAKQLRKHPAQLSRILSGVDAPPPMFWEKVAVLLNVPIERVRPARTEAAA